MPSPFPGMDPYLETQGRWLDFHSRFINAWSEAIADAVPENYEVSIGERVRLVGPPEGSPRSLMPDVAVVQGSTATASRPGSTGTATLEPFSVPRPTLEREEPPDRYIQVFKRPGRQLVTVLELLSPSNKEGDDRKDYLAKRNELMVQRTHLVELDLLIRGRRVPMGGPLPPGDYYAVISRGDIWPDSNVYAWTIRQALPSLPVPLSAPDEDALVDLAKVFNETYARGRYARLLAYGDPIPVPLGDEDRAWAQERVKRMRPGAS